MKEEEMIEKRFWSKVWKTDTCWLWTAYKDPRGYGQFWFEGRIQVAHRVSYKMLVGPIPSDLVLDHQCRTPACINPKHLRLMTLGENILIGIGPTAINARKTYCKNNHLFDKKNTYITPRNERRCRICHNKKEKKRYKEGKK